MNLIAFFSAIFLVSSVSISNVQEIERRQYWGNQWGNQGNQWGNQGNQWGNQGNQWWNWGNHWPNRWNNWGHHHHHHHHGWKYW
jgi:hypothetical protein